MTAIFPIPDSPTPAWLTAALRASGALPRGEVEAVAQEATGAFNSHTSRLRLRYSADAPPDAPPRLILKRNVREPWGVEAGADEVRFYTLAASLPGHPPVVAPCRAAAHDPASGDSYLLLDDLSETHAPPVTREQQIAIVDGIPAEAHLESVVDALAQLHGFWWERQRSAEGAFTVGHWSRDAGRFELYLERRRAAWESLRDGEAWLPPDVAALYERAFAGLRRHWESHLAPRFRSGAGLTLIHGDAYLANFLCPRAPGAGPAYLIDWQSPSFDLGGYDLANLCATFWTSEQRGERGREERMLRRYHAGLLAAGVRGYSWEDLADDYRAGLIFWLLMPLQDRRDGAGRDYWWPKMQCLAAAFREWRCEELL